MSNTWKRAAVALQLGFLGVILFVSAACAAVSTPAPSNTPGMEVTVRVSPKAGGTEISTSTTIPKATPEKTGEIPATVNAPKDTPESMPRSGGNGGDDKAASIPRSGGTGDDQALTIPDKGELKYPNLGSRLDDLVASVEAGETTAEQAARGAAVYNGAPVAVTIYLSGNVDEVVAFLEENGGDPRNAGEDYIEAYVPVPLLGPASEQPGVLWVREIVPPEQGQGG
jgi:hypothetical protein